MYRVLKRIGFIITKPVSVIAVLGNMAVLLTIFSQLIMRVIFKVDFTGYEELVMIFGAWLYFSSSVLGSYEQSHIKADILQALLESEKKKSVIKLVADFITLVIGIIFTVWAFNYIMWLVSNGVVTNYFRIPSVIGESSLLICLILMSYFHLLNLIDTGKRVKAAFGKGEIECENENEKDIDNEGKEDDVVC